MLPVIPVRGGSRGVIAKWATKIGDRNLLENAIHLVRCLYYHDDTAAYVVRSPIFITRDSDVIEFIEGAETAGVDFSIWSRSWSSDLDDADTLPVLQVCLSLHFDVLLLLQPTVTLCPAWVADRAIGAVLEGGHASAVSVVDVGERHPARMYWANGEPVLDGSFEPRQQLAPAYLRDGAVYAISRKQLLEGDSLLGNRPYLVKRHWSETWNIDHPADLKIAEALCTS